MALAVFIRGINVGGHRTFRPSVLARGLSDYGVANVGAAGTFVVRKPGSKAKFRAVLIRKLLFKAEVVLCDSRDLMGLETDNPFGAKASRPDIVRFVSILSRAGSLRYLGMVVRLFSTPRSQDRKDGKHSASIVQRKPPCARFRGHGPWI